MIIHIGKQGTLPASCFETVVIRAQIKKDICLHLFSLAWTLFVRVLELAHLYYQRQRLTGKPLHKVKNYASLDKRRSLGLKLMHVFRLIRTMPFVWRMLLASAHEDIVSSRRFWIYSLESTQGFRLDCISSGLLHLFLDLRCPLVSLGLINGIIGTFVATSQWPYEIMCAHNQGQA